MPFRQARPNPARSSRCALTLLVPLLLGWAAHTRRAPHQAWLAASRPQVPYNVGGMPAVSNTSQMNYVNSWQATALSVLNTLPTTAQSASSGVFSLSCLRHCLTMGPAFWTAQVLATSLATASSRRANCARCRRALCCALLRPAHWLLALRLSV